MSNNISSITALLYYSGVLAVLAWVAVRDIKTHRIPNGFVLGLLLYGELSIYMRTLLLRNPCYGPTEIAMCFLDAFLGGLLGGGLLLLTSIITKGGFGGGDVKLMAVLGFIFGVEETLAILASSLILAVWIGLIQKKYRRGPARIPFAPCLLLGCCMAAYFYIFSRCT